MDEQRNSAVNAEDDLFDQMVDAVITDNFEEADRLSRLIEFSPESLMAVKIAMGADHVKASGLRLGRADRRYGSGWLDR